MSLNRSKFLEESEDEVLRQRLTLKTRDETLLALARETGARATEILNLRKENLYPSTNTVFFKALKGSRDREIPIRPELMEALQRFLPFNIRYRRMEQIWQKYRPCDKKLHSLRHTFAVHLYKRTKDLKLTQLALGHKSLSSTQIYLDFIYEQESMKRILDVTNRI